MNGRWPGWEPGRGYFPFYNDPVALREPVRFYKQKLRQRGPAMRFPRAAGVLLHPTSLPGPYGIGDLGQGAYDFVDFLVKGRQSLWQVLPLGPTGYGDSPYQSFSSFAGNPLLISPEKLVENGYLPAESLSDAPAFSGDKVDYGRVITFKEKIIEEAHRTFQSNGSDSQRQALADFEETQSGWLNDYALFMALKEVHQERHGGVWIYWPTELVERRPESLNDWSGRLADEIAARRFAQFLFYEQWLDLRQYANDRGIRIIGDVPIFVAFDSADVWGNQELFQLKEDRSPVVIAGVPPDYFSETGQRWGNPLYRWDVMAANNYEWWALRLKTVFSQVDIVRVDHFRGFEAYWEIPAEEPTAVVGRWVKGPDAAFFLAMQEQLGELPIIAEDLGVITPGVEALRDRFDFPGMKILQFAFGGTRTSTFLPHNFGRNFVVYTGTHDNETTTGWYRNASPDEQDHLRRYVARDEGDIVWDMIRLALASVADTAVVPLQDLMQLGNEARMNFPGKTGGWWSWRFTPEMLRDDIANRLAEMTKLYGRDGR
jgi:4-alpha-glucanotransferase